MKKTSIFLILLGIGAVLPMQADAGTNGGTAGAFARVGANTRAKAMGNAFTAIAEGPAAIYFNPAALPFATQREVSASLQRMALDRRLDYLGFSTPLHPKAGPEQKPLNAGVGVGWLHAGVGDIDSRDFDGNPEETITQSSNLFLFGFGVQLHDRVGAGLTAKVVYETFGKIGDDETSVNGDGFGADAALYARPIDHLTLGAQIKNIGAKTTWNTTNYWSQGASKEDQWPLEYRFGAAYNYSGLTGAVDIESSEESETRLHVGAEAMRAITDRQSVALRAGYDAGSLNFGLGVGFAFWKVRSFLDITYTIEDIAPDDAQSLTWGVQF